MKRLFAFILIMLVLMNFLVSCGVKQTNKSLTVFFGTFPEVTAQVKKAIAQFEQDSGIKVNIYEQLSPTFTTEEFEDYYKKLSAVIMSGEGPDVFISNLDLSDDIYKMMDAGAFLDFNDLIQSDDSFSIDLYEKKVMDAGIYAGNRYIMPLNYTVPVAVTTSGKLKEFDVKKEDLLSYERLIDTALVLHDSDKALFTYMWSYSFSINYLGWLHEMIDYENKTVHLDAVTVDKCTNLIKNERAMRNKYGGIYEYDHNLAIEYDKGLISLNEVTSTTIMYLSGARNDDTVEMFPMPNYKGQRTASINQFSMISASSKNIDNAWSFVKTLLSDDCQSLTSQYSLGIGVKSSLIDKNIDQAIQMHSNKGSIPERYIIELKKIYKEYDNAVLTSLGSSRVFRYWSDYIFSDNPIDISELKETVKKEMEFWFNE